MTDDRFKRLLEERMVKIRKTLEAKKVEYAKTSRMHNFERASKVLGCSQERALMGIAVKHIVSVLDIVDQIEANMDGSLTLDFWNEKMGDAINYMCLLDVMVRSRKQSVTPSPTKER